MHSHPAEQGGLESQDATASQDALLPLPIDHLPCHQELVVSLVYHEYCLPFRLEIAKIKTIVAAVRSRR